MNKVLAMAIGVAVALIGSCAQTKLRWEHPDLPEQAWASDEADCQRRATDVAERELQQTQRIRASRDPRAPTLTENMDRFDAGRRQARTFNRCMTDKGYTQVAVEE